MGLNLGKCLHVVRKGLLVSCAKISYAKVIRFNLFSGRESWFRRGKVEAVLDNETGAVLKD